MTNQILTIFFFLTISLGLYAQEAVVASGGYNQDSNGSISYTIGQVVYTYENSSGGSIAQGVQQPFEIKVTTGADVPIQLKCKVYPNPTTDILILESTLIEDEITYNLYSLDGKLLLHGKSQNESTEINVSELKKGTYLFKVTSLNKELKTFKILKR